LPILAHEPTIAGDPVTEPHTQPPPSPEPRWRVRAAFDLVWTGGRGVGRAEAVRLEDAIAATGEVRAPAVTFADGEAVVSLLVQARDDDEAIAQGLHAVQCACRFVPGVALGELRGSVARADPELLLSGR
jgi:hypothetical protein